MGIARRVLRSTYTLLSADVHNAHNTFWKGVGEGGLTWHFMVKECDPRNRFGVSTLE